MPALCSPTLWLCCLALPPACSRDRATSHRAPALRFTAWNVSDLGWHHLVPVKDRPPGADRAGRRTFG